MSKWISIPIGEFFSHTITGEWGTSPTLDSSVPVLRSTNFTSDGKLDLQDIVFRNISTEKLRQKQIKKGDIIIEKSGGGPKQPAGRVVYCDADFDGTCSNFLEIARVFSKFDSKFIFYLLYHLYNSGLVLKYQQQTTGIINFKFGEYRSEVVQIPAEKPEQTKIAEVLSTIDRTIEQTEALIAKYRRIKAGLMHDLLTRGSDENGQLRDPATHKFKPSLLGLVPKEWEMDLVKHLFRMELGKMLNKAAKRDLCPKPYLGNKNVQWGWIDTSNIETMDFFPHEQQRYRLKKNDILICEGGEVGRTALWKEELEECYFQKAIHRLIPVEQRVTPQYMLHYMNFVVPKGVLQNLTSQTSIAHLTQEKLAELPVYFPKADEMSRITNTLDKQDKALRVIEIELNKLQRLKIGLMQDLLTGRVSVAPLLGAGERVGD